MDVSTKIMNETMRIAGDKVDTDDRIEVFNPYNNALVGTVPRGRAEHARRAFEIAGAYEATLPRYERQEILLRTAEIITSRKEEISDLITAELGISKKDSLYECGRAYDVFHLSGQLCIRDDGEAFS